MLGELARRVVNQMRPPKRSRERPSVVEFTPALELQHTALYRDLEPILAYPLSAQRRGIGCSEAGEIVCSMAPGLSERYGKFQTDTRGLVPHWWLEDAKGVRIDYTKRQFDDDVPEAERTQPGVLPVIRRGDPGYERYIDVITYYGDNFSQ